MKHIYHRVKVCTLFVLTIISQTFVWAQGCTPPTMTSPNTLTICSGQGVNLPLTANQPNVTFTWVATSNANILGESTTTQNSSTITDVLSCVGPTSTVTYTVTPNLPNCPGVPQTVTVNVVTAPLITSPGQLTICSGSSVGLTITTNSPGSTISWVATSNPNVTGESTTIQNGNTITDVLVNNTTVPQNVTYTVTAISVSGCTVNSIVVVTVNPTPVVTSTSTVCVCSGNPVGLSLTSSIGGTSFTWVATDNLNVSGESLSPQNTNTIADILINLGIITEYVIYSVTPTANGCVGPTQTVSVCVCPIPEMTSTNSLTICSGSSVNLVLTSNIPSATFSWVANSNANVTGESLASQSSSTITDVLTNTTQVNQTVIYNVTPVSNGTPGVTQTVTVTVTPNPAAIVNSTQLQSFGGSDWLVDCTLPGATSGAVFIQNGISNTLYPSINSYTINWGDGTPSFNTTTDAWTTNHIYNIGNYTLTYSMTSSSGCVSTRTYNVFVGSQPASPVISLPPSAQGCTPLTLTFPISNVSSNVAGTTYTVVFSDGTPPLTFTQANIPSSITHTFTTSSCGATFQNGAITENNAFGVSIQAVNPCGSASATAGPVRTSSPPNANFSIPSTLCVNGTGTTINTSTPGTIASSSSCTSSQAQIWTVSPASGWTTANNLGSTNGFTNFAAWTNGDQNISLTFNSQGTYTIKLIQKNTCSAADTATQTVIVSNCSTAPSMTSPSSVSICSGSAVNLPFTATLPNTTYSWVATSNNNVSGESTSNQSTATLNDVLINNSSIAQTVIYTVTPTSNGITGSAQTVSVTVNPSPTFTGSTNYQVCSGAPLGISLTSNTPNALITWVATPNSNVTGETTTPQTSNVINDVLTSFSFQTVVYTVTMNSNGCSSNQIIVVTVAPPPMILGPNTANICSGTAVNLPLTSDQAGVFFTWFGFDNTSVTGESTAPQNTSTITDVLVNATSISQIVMYQVNAINTAGCISMTSLISVTVNPSPVITNTIGTPCDVSICSGNSVNLPITSTIVGSTYSILATDNVAVTGETTILQQAQVILDILTNTSSVDQTVSYTVTPSFNGCTGPSEIINVCVTPIPVVSNTSNQTLCNGDTLNLTLQSATPGTTFVWNALSNAQVTGESVTPQNTSIITDILSHGEATEQMVVYEVTPTYNGCSGTLSFIEVYVQPNYSGTLDTTSAGSVVINGITYDSTGTFTQVLTSSNGCDSLLTIQFTLGLDDLEPSVFEVYPNPSNGVFYIVHQLAAGTPYEFIDPTGRVLFEGKLESGKTQIDTGNIASGTYYVRVGDKTGPSLIKE